MKKDFDIFCLVLNMYEWQTADRALSISTANYNCSDLLKILLIEINKQSFFL